MAKKRRPTHPGEILDEDYIKPLNLNLQKLADRLGIARNTLFKIRCGTARVTPALALSLAEAFDLAKQLGYRTYLYFIATEDPTINISRVQFRVDHGGHSVPKEKMIERYKRSIELLMLAIHSSNRAYIFDNSREQPIWIAEITDGKALETKTEELPYWFKRAVGDRLKY
ncbi:MAG TPA: HigA family addiction module antitoxin [Chlamydiales bacterium]|nr:HigA family addiction module antitoxin [Chlamydiales bacterium]